MIETQKQKRIEIAEWEGYEKQVRSIVWWHAEKGKYFTEGGLPNYFSCLNACHEAEKKLSQEQQIVYRLRLREIARKGQAIGNGIHEWEIIHSTPEQRAEALWRTIRKV